MKSLILILTLFSMNHLGFALGTNDYITRIDSYYRLYSQGNSDHQAVAAEISEYKRELISHFEQHRGDLPKLIHSIKSISNQSPVEHNVPVFGTLIDVLNKVDWTNFFEAAFFIVASPQINERYKNSCLNTVYSFAAVVKEGDTNVQAKAVEIMKLAAKSNHQSVQRSAISSLVGESELPLKGLDPSAGKRLLLEIVRDENKPFAEKEYFAFLLASVDQSYANFYEQNVRVLYLNDEKSNPDRKMAYAQRLSKLRRLSPDELKNFEKAAVRE